MTTYQSKTGKGIVLFLAAILGGTSIPMIYFGIWIGLLINVLIGVFIIHLFLTTNYRIEGNSLVIRSSFFFREAIDIHSIKKITASGNSASSPANSLDRLEIVYGPNKRILISPRNKAGFIEELKAINAGIEWMPKATRHNG